MDLRRSLQALLVLLMLSAVALPQQNPKPEDEKDYFKRWLKQDVIYIITPEESAVFEKLTTTEEKEKFIEQFWQRRDPDPRTSLNEFKEEHYRRIIYANEKFASGDPGWRTDRGKVYIIHGEPDSIESRPSGGFYQRQMREGGGTTSTYPFETWRYKYIEGLGSDVILEFVDSTFTGKYQLAVFPWEKDALMQMPGAGKTLAEQTGLATRADRPGLMPAAGGHGVNPNLMYSRVSDTPFARYEMTAKAQAPKPLQFQELKGVVKVNINYQDVPFEVHEQYFKLNDEQVLVPLTLRVRNRHLTFKPEGDLRVARLAIYGVITSMTNRVILEFDDPLVVTLSKERLEVGLQKSSIYQKIIQLDRKMRYRVDLVLKDLDSGKLGVVQKALIPPSAVEEKLGGSSLVLSDAIEPLTQVPEVDEMFVLGDVKIRPNMDNLFSERMPLGIYFQVYNASIDQSTLAPSLRATYNLLKDGQLLRSAVDENGESTQFSSGRRVVLIKRLSLAGLAPGRYQIELEITDRISQQTIKTSGEFTVVEERKLALGR